MVLDRQYPSSYDTSIQPISTLRTAHAVQLAAMNSQIESVTINGDFFLAKFMVITKTETFKDPENNSETMVCKPTVEAFLMDRHGYVQPAREHGFDYYELNSRLSSVLLQKLSRMYQPLHEIGQDETFLVDELQGIGLLPPQREAVKAVIKAYRSGRRGVGIRANTGTGKTWIAKAVKYLTSAKRTVMVSEPQLIPQLVKEYANEGFTVHVIDSWECSEGTLRNQAAWSLPDRLHTAQDAPEIPALHQESQNHCQEGWAQLRGIHGSLSSPAVRLYPRRSARVTNPSARTAANHSLPISLKMTDLS